MLVVCRDMKNLSAISQIRIRPEFCYIIASDDIRVHRAMEKYSWVNKVCFLHQMESLYHVADDVIRMIDAINLWFHSIDGESSGISSELLFWIGHVEGGMTSQRVQDALLLIRSYLYLLDANGITKIFVIHDGRMRWENEVLRQVALARRADFTMIGTNKTALLFRPLAVLAVNTIRSATHRVRVLSETIRRRSHNCLNGAGKKEIIFQLCSWADKHVENIVPIMKAVKVRGYEPIALCWTAEGGSDKVRSEGLSAVELEAFVSFREALNSFLRASRLWRNVRKLREEFCAHRQLCYRDVPLGSILWPSIRYFFTVELPLRYRLNVALGEYLRDHSPVAVKLWGGGSAIEGDLVLKRLRVLHKAPLLMYWFWLVFDYPYESKYEHIDLFLTAGKSQERYLKNLGVSDNRYETVGLARYDGLLEFKRKYSREASLTFLDIPSTYRMYILYDPSYVLRGFLSAGEQVSTTHSLLSFARTYPDVALLIKPHPSHYPGTLEALINSLSLENVFLLDKSMQPYHSLNACDLFITKYSTMGIEAMLFDRPVISVILDNEAHWKMFGEAAHYIDSTESLILLLEELRRDEVFFRSWAGERIETGRAFLNDFFEERTEDSAEMAADVIDKYIRTKQERMVS